MESDNLQLSRLLASLVEAWEHLAAGNAETVARVGATFEQACADLPPSLPKIPAVVNLALEVLQRLYEGRCEDIEAELTATAEALRAAQAWVEGGLAVGRAADLERAGHQLWVLLGREPQVSPFPAAVLASSAQLDDLAALLIGLSPDDHDDLRRVRGELQSLMFSPSLTPGNCELVREAEQRLTRLLDGEVAEADAELTAVAALVGSLLGLAQPAPEEPELFCLEFTGDAALLAEFMTESFDHLQRAEVALLDLEVNPEDREALNAVLRAFHTLKGTAGFLGLPVIQKLAHHAEALLDRARGGQIHLTGGYADLALEAADLLKSMIAELQEVGVEARLAAPPQLADLIERLRDPEGHGFSEEIHGAVPPARTGDILVAEGKVSRKVVEAIAQGPGEGPIGRKLVASEAASARDVLQALRTQKQSAEAEGSIRVRTDRLDALLNMVGELVIANSMLVQDEEVRRRHAEALGRKVGQLNKITRELQELGMSMRMVPLKATFQRMARVVRDLGQRTDKSVRLVTEGEETEIDRSLVEALSDPLLHLVRNAVDHGLEEAAQRVAAGKPETGTVCLRARHAAGHVLLELQDDGRGLNRDRILAQAVAQGVVAEGRELSDAEVYRLIFAPGLSTARQVTDISGRGVGMDVVARNIEALRGRIEIASAPGKGSTFTLRVPLTLAIMDGMLVGVGGERYILPTNSIQKACCAEPGAVHTLAGGTEVVDFGGQILPVVRLHRLFNIPGARTHIAEALLVLVEGDTRRYALLVDELLGQQQIVIKSLGAGLGQIPGVSGSAILGDGRVGLILDPKSLVEEAAQHLPAAELALAPAA
jgi:two-component system, chemotaxis family, sensor kinase CheA